MPFAARIQDNHTCPQVNPGSNNPHTGGPIFMGPGGQPRTVMIEGKLAAVEGDMCTCTGPVDTIKKGSTTVTICGQPAARIRDMTQHGGMISSACSKVMIGG